MKKNKTNGIIVLVVLGLVLVAAMYLVLNKTFFNPSASKSKAEFRANNRALKSEAVLVTTPVINTKANLSQALKDLDGENPDKVVVDLPQNDTDSKSF